MGRVLISISLSPMDKPQLGVFPLTTVFREP